MVTGGKYHVALKSCRVNTRGGNNDGVLHGVFEWHRIRIIKQSSCLYYRLLKQINLNMFFFLSCQFENPYGPSFTFRGL